METNYLGQEATDRDRFAKTERRTQGSKDVTAINSAIDELNNVFQRLLLKKCTMHNNNKAAHKQGAPHADQQQQANNGGKDQEVTDVDFEEVK